MASTPEEFSQQLHTLVYDDSEWTLGEMGALAAVACADLDDTDYSDYWDKP